MKTSLIDKLKSLIYKNEDTSEIEIEISINISDYYDGIELYTLNIKYINRIMDKCYGLAPDMIKTILQNMIVAYGDLGYSILGHIKCKNLGEEIITALKGLSSSPIILETLQYLNSFDNVLSREKYIPALNEANDQILDLQKSISNKDYELLQVKKEIQNIHNELNNANAARENDRIKFQKDTQGLKDQINSYKSIITGYENKLNNQRNSAGEAISNLEKKLINQRNYDEGIISNLKQQLNEQRDYDSEIISNLEQQLNEQNENVHQLTAKLIETKSKLDAALNKKTIARRRYFSELETDAIFSALKERDIKSLEKSFNKDPSLLFVYDSRVDNALMAAIKYNWTWCIEFIVKFIKSNNISGILDNTSCLMLAYNMELFDVVNILIDNGVCFDAKDENGNTLLIKACELGHFNIVQKLVSKGAYLNAMNNEKMSPVLSALANEHFEIAELLITKGANKMITDKKGNTILHYAAKYNAVDVAQCLLPDPTIINVQNKKKQTPLFVACKHKNYQFADFLISHKANPSATMHLACYKGLENTVEYLIRNGVNVDCPNIDESTPLLTALLGFQEKLTTRKDSDCWVVKNVEVPEHIKVIKTLIHKGANLYQKNIKETTPLTVIHALQKRGEITFDEKKLTINLVFRR